MNPHLRRGERVPAVLGDARDHLESLRSQWLHDRGFAFRQKLVSDGARQIISIHIPGEFLDLQNCLLKIADHNVQALTRCTVAIVNKEALAQLIGEKEFPTLSHEGERESIHICIIGRTLLVVVFDERSSLGLVKLRVKQASRELATIFDEITRESEQTAQDNPLLAGITDDDIDSLFSS